ncbi:MAG: hypothetical protein LBC70_07830, partial [Chitinispirillales bacterium]|nr:hypothetical protein [Chitinispirillales bacterium]
MGNKKLVLGLGVIVLVGAIFIISGKLTSISPPEHRTRFFPELEERHITAIVINDKGSTTTLEKREGVWMVGDEEFFPAEETLVQIAIERIVSLRKTELI